MDSSGGEIEKEKRNGQILIELVPTSWLCEDGNKCYFPPSQMDAPGLIQEAKPPSPKWKTFAVKLIKSADTFEQGMRRLKRAYKDAEPLSTEVDSPSAYEKSEDDDAEDLLSDGSSTSPSTQKKKMLTNGKKTIDPVKALQIMSSDSDNDNSATEKNDAASCSRKRKRSRGAEEVNRLEPLFHQLYQRIEESDKKNEMLYKKLCKQVKSAKQSILYDLAKTRDSIKNTVVLNRGPGPINNLRKCKDTIGTKLPIDNLATFIECDTSLALDEEKDAALRDIMASFVATSGEVKEAVRKILGGLMMKAVQELYSGTGRKGPNGVTKLNFSATHMYQCMQDIIKTKIDGANEKSILTATSRYLSGAGDREGGKAERDAAKKK